MLLLLIHSSCSGILISPLGSHLAPHCQEVLLSICLMTTVLHLSRKCHSSGVQSHMQTILGSSCEISLTVRSLLDHVTKALLQVKEVPRIQNSSILSGIFIRGIFSFYCWSFIYNSFAIRFHMVVNVLKKILVCVGECEQVPVLTIHRYYQQQLVLRTGHIVFAEVLFCSVSA